VDLKLSIGERYQHMNIWKGSTGKISWISMMCLIRVHFFCVRFCASDKQIFFALLWKFAAGIACTGSLRHQNRRYLSNKLAICCLWRFVGLLKSALSRIRLKKIPWKSHLGVGCPPPPRR
jgi:hypothetical protein